ncbi:MAG: T9SS type A sorting domain-containing protein [Melioribacteraceae bacterium]|nr:T9SS type A sorting domain-containing protein [Melioribacteraceae bacterium]
MKLKLTAFIIMLCGISLFAQDYPLVSISDINKVSDDYLNSITTPANIPSPMDGDTVRIRGTVLFAPMVDWENDRRLTTSSGSRGAFLTWIQDLDGSEWGGIQIEQTDTFYQTGIDIIDTGDVVEITGVISEGFYGNTTIMAVLIEPLTEIEIVDNIGSQPDPIIVDFSDFFTGTDINVYGEKYESMYIEFNNVVTGDRNPTGSTQFTFTDGSGNIINVYDQSGYFSTRGHRLIGKTDYDTPADGTLLEHIRGILHTRDEWFLVPLYPGDMKIGTTAPATISLIEDAPARVLPNEETTVKFKITDVDGSVASAQLSYKMESEDSYTTIDMQSEDTAYVATIPGFNSDSTMVQYYITAVDDSSNVSTSPNNIENETYYYWVLKDDPTIYHLQYTPFRGGDSRFDGEEVTVTAIVTVDSADNQYNHYIQEPTGDKWVGMRLRKVPANGQARGDMVTVTGTVLEDFYVTTIDVTDLTVVSKANAVPEPILLPTSAITTGRNDAAEEYESMLVKYENVTVVSANADGSELNYGEIFVDDGSGQTRAELEEGYHHYHNNSIPGLSDSTGMIEVLENSEFESVTGVLYYSFSNWKLIPRQDDDFMGYTDVEEVNQIPARFNLEQNYPNPFNPTTVVEFSLMDAGMTNIKVYNALGEEITTLINEMKNAGTYRVNFNAMNLPSGVYFYKLQSGANTQVKKMMLIK